mmetsp:Transcript_22368/g.30564  ORF Transcript_22368/g.30564 Transcript_22368/m.30564 type:complete len:120 (-) Transcript_22368:475-834(-)
MRTVIQPPHFTCHHLNSTRSWVKRNPLIEIKPYVIVEGSRISEQALDVVVACSIHPERPRSKSSLATEKEFLPVPEGDHLISGAMDNEYRRVDAADAVNIWEKVSCHGKAEVEGHSIRG